MKKFWIYLLTIIILILIYGQYQNYKRFALENYEYKVASEIDLTYHDKSFLLDYYESVEDLNTYVKSQWSANSIDVRVPEEDDEEHKAAAKIYSKKLATVKYYESQLIQSSKLKGQGMINSDIKSYLEDGVTAKDKLSGEHRTKMLGMFGAIVSPCSSPRLLTNACVVASDASK